VIPYHQSGINDRDAAIGVNVNVPIMNGNLFGARHPEAARWPSACAIWKTW
jgi:hypothetical protein